MNTEYRDLKKGDVVQIGDVIRLACSTNETRIACVVHGNSKWIGMKIKDSQVHLIGNTGEPARFAREVRSIDPSIARAKRQALAARRRTTLGKLEALLIERAQWQRRQTIAINKLAETQRKIEALARTLADEKFDSELTNTAKQDSQ